MKDNIITLTGHLEELRRRVLGSAAAFLICAVIIWYFSPLILHILKLPAGQYVGKLKFFKPAEGFIVYMNISMAGGLILASPVILYNLWAFVAPAISAKAHRYIPAFILVSLGCFLSGCAFAYFIMLPPALKFLLSFAQDQMEYIPTAGAYISFTTMIILSTGLIFLLPVLTYVLSKLGIITTKTITSKWRYIVLAIFIAAAAITPTPDMFNMLLMALPMLLLYGVSIVVTLISKPKIDLT